MSDASNLSKYALVEWVSGNDKGKLSVLKQSGSKTLMDGIQNSKNRTSWSGEWEKSQLMVGQSLTPN